MQSVSANPPSILAIETSAAQCSVALLSQQQIHSMSRAGQRGHTESVLQMTQALLTQAGLSLSELSAIAYSQGPGSFTGVRLACAITQGLAVKDDIPVIGISSLQVLAQTAYDRCQCDAVLTCLDARNDSVYWGAYQLNHLGIMTAMQADRVAAPAQVSVPEEANWIACGNGWQQYQSQFPTDIQRQVEYQYANCLPHARSMLMIAKMHYQQQQTQSVDNALPIYLRDDIAQPQPAEVTA